MNLDRNEDFKPNVSPISLKTEKEKHDNIFSKKWKNFKKELTPAKQDEQIKNQYNKSSSGNGGERIITGSENLFSNQTFVEKKVEVSKEILAKYDGKSKEVSWVNVRSNFNTIYVIWLSVGCCCKQKQSHEKFEKIEKFWQDLTNFN